MIYTHVLPTTACLAFAVRWTGFEVIQGGCFILIRIKRPDNPTSRTKPKGYKGFSAPLEIP